MDEKEEEEEQEEEEEDEEEVEKEEEEKEEEEEQEVFCSTRSQRVRTSQTREGAKRIYQPTVV